MIRGELKTRSSFTKKDFGFSRIDSESLLNENSYLATQNNLSTILDQNRFKDFNDWENWVTEKDKVFNLAEFGAPLKSTLVLETRPWLNTDFSIYKYITTGDWQQDRTLHID